MKTFVCLLRAVNVGGSNKLTMADWREIFSRGGVRDVKTYIQSGNAVFRCQPQELAKLKETMMSELLHLTGNPVDVIIYPSEEFRKLIQWPGTPPDAHAYYVFFVEEPSEEAVNSLRKENFKNEEIQFGPGVAYLYCREGMGKARLDNSLIEKRLKVRTTTRNQRTVFKLIEICSAIETIN